MIPIAIKLFLGGVFKRLSGLFGLVRAYPRETIIIALLAISAALWISNASKDRQIVNMKVKHVKEIEKLQHAGQQALAAQIKLHDETKAAYAAKAKEANDDYAKDLAAASTAADRYANANRVRKVCVSRPSETSASAENSDPGIPEVAPAETELVAVTRTDFDKCTALYPYANGAYKWGVVLREAGLAE